jgi:hypothetical protein
MAIRSTVFVCEPVVGICILSRLLCMFLLEFRCNLKGEVLLGHGVFNNKQRVFQSNSRAVTTSDIG